MLQELLERIDAVLCEHLPERPEWVSVYPMRIRYSSGGQSEEIRVHFKRKDARDGESIGGKTVEEVISKIIESLNPCYDRIALGC